ncbi:MAG: bifunctional homocysteine S-methyltransferase/methylenetetrahydrofolate reductase [Myxococcota bacterium]|nr:bifunctional homocysteine S-methyltransferase/methylenetetrahydrofolate reductase [Myxococcota bacterium]
MEKPFLEALEQQVMVFDGAVGTLLYDRGVFINQCFENFNLVDQDLVRSVHRDYLKAGAHVLETNTFGGNRFKLAKHHLDDRLTEINRTAAELARDVAGDDAYVAGAIGPLGIRIEPWGPTALHEARDAFREQAVALLEGGVDLFMLETFTDLSEMGQALRAIREAAPDLPVVAQMTVGRDGNSLYGTEPEVFAPRMVEWGANVVGVNCSVGPAAMLYTLEKLAACTDVPLSALPNGGLPKNVDGRLIYLSSPDYFAKFAQRFIEAGARVVGGCCGTTPEHIRAIAGAVRMDQGAPRLTVTREPIRADTLPEPIPLAEKCEFGAKLAAGEFVTSVELTPPRGWRLKRILESARALKEQGFDAVNVPDGPRASSRMGPLAMSVRLQDEVGVESILHYVCRDRNILGMQSDLLGAHTLGIRNLLLVTGDPPVIGDYPKATAVFDVDSIGLTNIVSRLNTGFDIGHRSIGEPTGFLIGVGANPTAVNMQRELDRFYWKVDAGAEYVITQPMFEVDPLFDFLDKVAQYKIPVIVGIWPLQSLRNAEFLSNEVPGVTVPEDTMKRMRRAKTREEQWEVGLDLSREILTLVHERVQGLQISAPFNRAEPAKRLLSYLRDELKR